MNLKKWVGILLLVILIGIISYINYSGTYNQTLINALYSVTILIVAYLVNNFIYSLIKRQVHETRERYVLRKASSTIISILMFGFILVIWIKETTSIVVAYGIFSAGVAIALQDLLKNVAGGIIIFLTGSFKAGDRIQVENDVGDVLDIKIFTTAIMEIKEWVDGDQYSGRIIQIPNSFILSKTVKNYTKDFSFIWDELHLMLTYDSNWKKGQDIVLKIAHEVTDPFKASAKNELLGMGEKYLINPSDVEEKIYTNITDNWIDMRLRYVVDPRMRRRIKNSLNEKIIEAFSQEEEIKIASTTFEIVGFPKIKMEE